MNDLIESLVKASGFDRDAEAWERQEPALCVIGAGGVHVVWSAEADAPGLRLASVLADQEHVWAVYPTGLVVPLRQVPWFWEYPEEVRAGTAEQAAKYARSKGIDPADVFPVCPSRVHGTCVRYDGVRLDGRDYRLVYARPFPLWCWMGGYPQW